MNSSQLSALIITYNEEANIKRTLNSLRWLDRVLIIDSGSTDRTLEIASDYDNTQIKSRGFDNFANQCNFGLSCLCSDWVLSLDADYVISLALENEIRNLFSSGSIYRSGYSGYHIRFHYCVNGKPIRSSLLPPRICLYIREYGSYINEGHGHRIKLKGPISRLQNKIYHDDRKPLSIWLMTQKRYQAHEAAMLRNSSSSGLPIQDLIRKHTFLAPFAALFMCLLMRGGIFDGKEGMIYAFQRFIAESLLYLSMNLDCNDQKT